MSTIEKNGISITLTGENYSDVDGNTTHQGTDGLDAVTFSQNFADATITVELDADNAEYVLVSTDAGEDRLYDIEYLQFADKVMGIDWNGFGYETPAADDTIYAYRLEGMALQWVQGADGADAGVGSDPVYSTAVIYGSQDLVLSFIRDNSYGYDDDFVLAVSSGSLYDMQINGVTVAQEDGIAVNWFALEELTPGTDATPVQIFSADTAQPFTDYEVGGDPTVLKELSHIFEIAGDTPYFPEVLTKAELQAIVDKVEAGTDGYSLVVSPTVTITLADVIAPVEVSDIPDYDNIITEYDADIDAEKGVTEFTLKGFVVPVDLSGDAPVFSAPRSSVMNITGSSDLQLYFQTLKSTGFGETSASYDQLTSIVSGEIYKIILNDQTLDVTDTAIEIETTIEYLTSDTFGAGTNFIVQIMNTEAKQAEQHIFYLDGDLGDQAVPSYDQFMSILNEVDTSLDAAVPVEDGLIALGSFEHVETKPVVYSQSLTGEITGTSGSEKIVGTAGDDTIRGLAGDDMILGGDGNDFLDPGAGNDSVFGEDGDDTISQTGTGTQYYEGGAGTDTYQIDSTNWYDLKVPALVDLRTGYSGLRDNRTSPLNDKLTGFENLEMIGGWTYELHGTDGNNAITSGSGDDTVYGYLGNDTISTGDGNDVIINLGGSDIVDGGDGVDWVITDLSPAVINPRGIKENSFDVTLDLSTQYHGSIVNDFSTDVFKNIENYQLIGNFQANLTGDAQDNHLISDLGNDTLKGGAGNDTLEGGAGNDIIDGGEGHDTVVFNSNFADAKIYLNKTDDLGEHISVKTATGTDILYNVEELEFADRSFGVNVQDGLQSSTLGADDQIYAYRLNGIAIEGMDVNDSWQIQSDTTASTVIVYGSADLEVSLIEDLTNPNDPSHRLSVSRGELYDMQFNGVSLNDYENMAEGDSSYIGVRWVGYEELQLGLDTTPFLAFSVDTAQYTGFWDDQTFEPNIEQRSHVFALNGIEVFSAPPTQAEMQAIVDSFDQDAAGYSSNLQPTTVVKMADIAETTLVSDIPGATDGLITEYDPAIDGDVSEYSMTGFTVKLRYTEEDEDEFGNLIGSFADYIYDGPSVGTLSFTASDDLTLASKTFFDENYDETGYSNQEITTVSGEVFDFVVNGTSFADPNAALDEAYVFIEDFSSTAYGNGSILGIELYTKDANYSYVELTVLNMAGDKLFDGGVPTKDQFVTLLETVETSNAVESIKDGYFTFDEFEHVVIEGANTADLSDNNIATGAVTFTGAVKQGATLTADISKIEDVDGKPDRFTYAWLADGVGITGASENSLILTQAEVGKKISLQVSFTDKAGNKEIITSAPTPYKVLNVNDPMTGTVEITGTPEVGQTLTAEIGNIIDADGIKADTVVHQWLKDGVAIRGATEATYTITENDTFARFEVIYSHQDQYGAIETARSAPTKLVIPEDAISTGLESGGSVAASIDLAGRISKVESDISDATAAKTNVTADLSQFVQVGTSETNIAEEDTNAQAAFVTKMVEKASSVAGTTLEFSKIDVADQALDAPIVLQATAEAGKLVSYVFDAGQDAEKELQIDGVAEFLVVSGNAKIRGGEGSNNFLGDAGAQNVMLGADDDTLNAGAGDDIVGSAGGDDIIDAGSGNDVAFGGIGDDQVIGGSGNDTVTDSWGSDYLDGGDGDDFIMSFAGNDTIEGGAGNDTIKGGRGDDLITGGDGDDILLGDTRLQSSRGNDRLDGGAGDDFMQGGYGADTFVFQAVANAEDAETNVIARITDDRPSGSDFEIGVDVVELSGFGLTNATVMDAQYWSTNEYDQAVFAKDNLSVVFYGISVADLEAAHDDAAIDVFQFIDPA